MLLSTDCCALHKPGLGATAPLAEVGDWRSHVWCRNPPRGTHKLQEGKPLSPAVPFQHSLRTRLSIMPTGTGKLFKGLKPIFAEQAVKGEFGVEGINEIEKNKIVEEIKGFKSGFLEKINKINEC